MTQQLFLQTDMVEDQNGQNYHYILSDENDKVLEEKRTGDWTDRIANATLALKKPITKREWVVLTDKKGYEESINESVCHRVGGYCGGLCSKYHCYFSPYDIP
jgi:hypothetical protein